MGDDLCHDFICACCIEDVAKAKELIAIHNLSQFEEWSGDYRLLRDALEEKHRAIAKLLLESGSKVNSEDESSIAPLHFTVIYKDTEIISMLLERCADVGAKNIFGQTALHLAVEMGNMEMTELLVSKGATIKYPWEIVYGYEDEKFWKIMKFLVDNDSGIDINGRDKYGRTAINNITCNRYRYPRMSDMYKDCEDVVDLRRDLVKTLLSRGADGNAQMPCGWSLLHSAVNNNDDEFVDILLKNKANVNIACTDDMRTPLHLAASNGNYKNTKILIDAGARVNVKNILGESPLHCASTSKNKKVVELLLEFGAKIDDTGYHDETPLHLAASEYFPNVKPLLRACAGVEYRNKDGLTALHCAASCQQDESVEELLVYGADINHTCKPAELPAYARKYYGQTEDNVEKLETLILLNICYNQSDCDHLGFFDNILDVIRQHITKLKSLNMYVDKRFLESSLFVNESEEYRITCEHEVELMKREKIRRSNVSYYDILKKSTDQLASLTRNKRITDILESLSRTKRFPIFRKMLYYHLKKGQHRGHLLRSSLKTFNVLSRYALPESVSFDLLMYLRNRDLVNLIDADPNNDRR
uniref:Ankyrin repeat domain protein n=1 Tax=Glypta fumiferanae TaxID=389681 RepID=A0A0F6QA45_9HYME|nr:ankyrin repeat domain protein [Glypta fumiferanae]